MTEMEHWKTELQQLQKENEELKRKLCSSKIYNKTLMADIQQAAEEIIQRDTTINFLNRQVPGLKRCLNEAVSSRVDAEKEVQKVQEELKRRDEGIVHLQRLLFRENKKNSDLRELQNSEKSLKEEVRKLKELLNEKEQEISRTTRKRQMRTKAHIDTLTLLNLTRAAQKESEKKLISLEEEFNKTLAAQEERHLKELSKKEESFRKELSEATNKARTELSELSGHLEEREHHCVHKQRELEEMFQEKEHFRKQQEIQKEQELECLKEENTQLG